MGSYNWDINHECDEDETRGILENFEFEQVDEDRYIRTINDWKPIKVEIQDDNDLQIKFHWMGDSTTEVYFDYLINAGVVIGQLMWALEKVSKGDVAN